MIAGFRLADDRSAGTFRDGLSRVIDYTPELIAEAIAKAGSLPGLMWRALVETLNIAAVSTILGTVGGGAMALLAMRGRVPWPRLVPVVGRCLDLARAIPELVIALLPIFVPGSGPVLAAIAFHTVGALGKLFSEMAEKASLKPVEGLESVTANWLERIRFGVLPQVAPDWAS